VIKIETRAFRGLRDPPLFWHKVVRALDGKEDHCHSNPGDRRKQNAHRQEAAPIKFIIYFEEDHQNGGGGS